MKAWDIVGYAWFADYHCVECTRDAFQAGELTSANPDDTDSEGIPNDAEDQEGNPVSPVFADYDDPAGLFCGSCHEAIVEPDDEYAFGDVFVFGSNLAGIHGAGAATDALDYYGAVWGQAEGRQGQSYAIPTKTTRLEPLSLDQIKEHIETFIAYARAHPDNSFQVTAIGCGLAGYTAAEIAPMFKDAPDNCEFDYMWKEFLPGATFWGSFDDDLAEELEKAIEEERNNGNP